jgi:hypothetical protein
VWVVSIGHGYRGGNREERRRNCDGSLAANARRPTFTDSLKGHPNTPSGQSGDPIVVKDVVKKENWPELVTLTSIFFVELPGIEPV